MSDSDGTFNVTEFLAEISRSLARTVGEANFLCVYHGRDVRPAKCDRVELERLLVSLAAAMRDRMRDGGTLSIRTSNHIEEDLPHGRETIPSGAYVRIEVSDTGSKIPEQKLEQIAEITRLAWMHRWQRTRGPVLTILIPAEIGRSADRSG